MLVLANLLSKNETKIKYSFGASKENLDGILYIDKNDFSASYIEKSSAEVPWNWGMRVLASLSNDIKAGYKIPEIYEYYPGY